ncbi:hypothetical protein MP228_002471 [Amoeboaphelidium protococcarum]|nr:hypothetical protein MP228_002471 [Amoeboaphelidium protococcarum]
MSSKPKLKLKFKSSLPQTVNAGAATPLVQSPKPSQDLVKSQSDPHGNSSGSQTTQQQQQSLPKISFKFPSSSQQQQSQIKKGIQQDADNSGSSLTSANMAAVSPTVEQSPLRQQQSQSQIPEQINSPTPSQTSLKLKFKPKVSLNEGGSSGENRVRIQEQQQHQPGLSRSQSMVSIASRKSSIASASKKQKVKPPRIPDSDEDETLNPVEEHLIFRLPRYEAADVRNLPAGSYAQKIVEATNKIKQMIKTRSVDIKTCLKIEFKDQRRVLLTYIQQSEDGGDNFNTQYSVQMCGKLVDLPCIIEAQRSFDRRQFHKISDICQMIQVEKLDFGRVGVSQGSIENYLNQYFAQSTQGAFQSSLNEDYISNSGITPPLKHCRVRRFRKRVNRRTVESIEREVARLLKEDAQSLEVVGSFIDAREVEERLMRDADNENDEQTQGDGETEGAGGTAEVNEDGEAVVDEDDDEDDQITVSEHPGTNKDGKTEQTSDDDDEEEEEEEDYGGDGKVANGQLGDGAKGDGAASDAQKDGDQMAEGEEVDDALDIENEPDPELRSLLQQNKLLNEEMADLNQKLDQKTAQKQAAGNPIIIKRFDDIIIRLKDEVEKKKQSLAAVQRSIVEKRQSIADDEDDMDDAMDLNEEDEGDAGEVQEVGATQQQLTVE